MHSGKFNATNLTSCLCQWLQTWPTLFLSNTTNLTCYVLIRYYISDLSCSYQRLQIWSLSLLSETTNPTWHVFDSCIQTVSCKIPNALVWRFWNWFIKFLMFPYVNKHCFHLASVESALVNFRFKRFYDRLLLICRNLLIHLSLTDRRFFLELEYFFRCHYTCWVCYRFLCGYIPEMILNTGNDTELRYRYLQFKSARVLSYEIRFNGRSKTVEDKSQCCARGNSRCWREESERSGEK